LILLIKHYTRYSVYHSCNASPACCIEIVCCRACKSTPMICISASFDPSSCGWTPLKSTQGLVADFVISSGLRQTEIWEARLWAAPKTRQPRIAAAPVDWKDGLSTRRVACKKRPAEAGLLLCRCCCCEPVVIGVAGTILPLATLSLLLAVEEAPFG